MPLPELELRSLGCPARSQSLNLLAIPAVTRLKLRNEIKTVRKIVPQGKTGS
jgi:hypothetical protein